MNTQSSTHTPMWILTREQLNELLTTAALIGRDDTPDAQTRGDVAEIVQRRMRKIIDSA